MGKTAAFTCNLKLTRTPQTANLHENGVLMAIDPALNAANVIAGIAGAIAANTATGGASSALASALLLRDLWKRFRSNSTAMQPQIQAMLAAELDRHHLLPAHKLLIPQMVGLVTLTPQEIMATARDPARISAAILAKLDDPAHRTPQVQDAFSRVITPIFTQLLADSKIADALRPAFENAVAETLRYIAEQSEVLVAQLHDTAKRLAVQETLLCELARRYAPGTEGDFTSAHRGIEAALQAAVTLRDLNKLPSNLDAQVQAVLDKVRSRAATGDLAGANTALDAFFADLVDKETEIIQAKLAGHRAGELIARQANNPARAADHVLARLALDAPGDMFAALRTLRQEWFETGRDKGLRFESEVAISLAEITLSHAKTANSRGVALNDLGTA